MLTFLRVENFKCFYEPTEFSMYATRERRDRETLAKHKGIYILPTTGLFGANASGKSTFIEALEYLQDLLSRDADETQPLKPVVAHKNHYDEPTKFEIEFLHSDSDNIERLYCYRLSLIEGVVESESLHIVTPNTGAEHLIFSYENSTVSYGELSGEKIIKNQFAEGVAKTRDAYKSQLLFSKLAEGMKPIMRILHWFHKVTIIAPDALFFSLQSGSNTLDKDFSSFISDGISEADSGITNLGLTDITPSQVPLSPKDLEKLENFVSRRVKNDEEKIFTFPVPDGRMYVLSYSQSSGPQYKEMIAHHKNFVLSVSDESRGTRRYLDLMPTLLDDSGVYVIDEIDAALHPHLVKRFVRSFLEQCTSNSRKQLIFTTHALELLFLDELRRDEVWFVDKTPTTADETTSTLTRLSEFSGVRKGSDVVKLYLGGQLGGIPQNI